MYKEIKINGKVLNYIFRISDSMTIPFDTANRDYQEYLKWIAEGNTPIPADTE